MRKRSVQLLAKWFGVVCFSLLLYPSGYGQSLDLKFDHITSENGLPQNTIYGIVKDKYGFMWFGTWSGLCRYDGYKFRVYRHQPGDLKSINNNRINNVVKDPEQNIWVLTFDDSALCKYNYDTDDFEVVPSKNVPRSVRDLINRRHHADRAVFNSQGYRFKVDSASNTLVQTYIPTGKQKIYTANPVNRWALNDSYVSDLYLDSQNILWVGTYNNGVDKANINAKPFHYYYHDVNDKNSIIDDNVRAITEDKQRNLWIGTRDKGITIISKNKIYRNLHHVDGDESTINSDQIKRIYCDSRGYVWIGTKTGLNCYDPATGRIRNFDDSGIKGIRVFGIVEDHALNVWFTTWNGIYKYVPQTDKLIHYDQPGLLKTDRATSVIEDRSHHLWVGTEGGGLTVFEQMRSGLLRQTDHFDHVDNDPRTISDDRINILYEDKEGFIWIGTGNGLDRFDPGKRGFVHFSVSPTGLTSSTIAGIIEDNKGTIWVSHTRGISKIDRNTLSVRNYSLLDGLQSNEFYDNAVFKSPRTGMLYFGGNNGYNTFYPDSIKLDVNPPLVVFTELQVLNEPVAVNASINGNILLKKPLYLSKELSLTYKDKSIAIEFAALNFANPSGNKYAYMLEGFDKDWVFTDATRRVATYSNLESGTYTFKVKASNSDGVWSATPQTLKIVVLPPWWLGIWAYILYFIILVACMYVFYYYTSRLSGLKAKIRFETILHEKELELRQSKIEFFTNISHEIKTPLSLILAPIEKLMAFAEGNILMNYHLQTLKNNGNRLLKLVNQLLDIRKFESGNDPLNLEVGDLISFIKRIVDAFHALADDKAITLTFSADTAIVYACFDPDKIEKIMYNLLSNAIKFTQTGGKVKVALRQEVEVDIQWTILEVIDNGLGIPVKELEQLFKPFHQARSNKSGGTGLGLAYAKALVELHGGTISAQSKTLPADQRQTSFTVKLPIQPELSSALQLKPIPAAEPAMELAPTDKVQRSATPPTQIFTIDGKPPVLLFVEDDLELRKYLKSCLAEEYTILEAANGVEGLAMAVKHNPDLIVSDVMMPEMDGIELCKRLKADLLTSHIPVILLTAKSAIEYKIEGIETGADDYIVKPFNLKLIALTIKNLLTNRMKLRDKYRMQFSIQTSPGVEPVSPDEKLLKRVFELVEEKLSDSNLNIEEICDKVGLSRTHLYRKMKALTGLSMAEMIKDMRLKRAQQLLSRNQFNVNEISYMVGFADTDYFRKCFKAQFGLSPSEYAKKAP